MDRFLGSEQREGPRRDFEAEERKKPKFFLLHLPHTGGRVLGRYCFFNPTRNFLGKVHNLEKEIEFGEDALLYFVLRNPTQRLIAEYQHYSRSLLRSDVVNDMNRTILNPADFSEEDRFRQYCLVGRVRNRYCRFFLATTMRKVDPDIEIDEALFDEIFSFVKVGYFSGRIKFDFFGPDEKRPIFLSLCDSSERPNPKSLEEIRQMYHPLKTLSPRLALSEEVALEANIFDLRLFEWFSSLREES